MNESSVKYKRLDSRAFKAREIPKEVKIGEKDSQPLKSHKEKLRRLKSKRSSLSLAPMTITLKHNSDSGDGYSVKSVLDS